MKLTEQQKEIALRDELSEQVECSTIVIDNLESRLNKSTVKLAAMKQQRDYLLEVLEGAECTLAGFSAEAWSGTLLKKIKAAIASVKGGA